MGYIDLRGNEVMKIKQDFDYSIYHDYCYLKSDGERWGWENEKAMLLDLSKCSNERRIYFKDWKPILLKEIS